MLPWSRPIYNTNLGGWPEKAGNPSPYPNPRIPAPTLGAKFQQIALKPPQVSAAQDLRSTSQNSHVCAYCLRGPNNSSYPLYSYLFLPPVFSSFLSRVDGIDDG